MHTCMCMTMGCIDVPSMRYMTYLYVHICILYTYLCDVLYPYMWYTKVHMVCMCFICVHTYHT